MASIVRYTRIGVGVVAFLIVSSSAHAVLDGCAVVLRTPDEFLAVRAGPSASHRETHRLYPGQMISTNHVSDSPYAGDWWRIAGVVDAIGSKEQPLHGWVNSRYLAPVDCCKYLSPC
jgi:hypothetical protein